VDGVVALHEVVPGVDLWAVRGRPDLHKVRVQRLLVQDLPDLSVADERV
jgi:hypothetical protein